jgi:dolichol-phosphate mannosyltransferase
VAEHALVVVPTYNERANIEKLIESVLCQDPRLDILVVDDGSPDGTGEIVDQIAETNPRVHALHRPRKMGLGTAYLAGFKWALERDYDYVLEMDAQFLEAIRDADLVLGSRYRGGKVTVVNWPMTRLLLSYFANGYARFVTGVPLDDRGDTDRFRRSDGG